ncbi:MAG TPA: A24 family peptidase [Pirellulales bacterium]|nr:A24 family peptidase [Pirellulales bacterium]
MLLFPSLPTELHLLAAFAIGVIAGGVVNWAIYSLRFDPLPHSPWSRLHPRDADDHWIDRAPMIGWWRLRRKGKALGYEFWIRPLLIELGCGLLAAVLYALEVVETGQAISLSEGLARSAQLPVLASSMSLHLRYVSHLCLAMWMVALSFIDIDEQTIPDEVTLPGTLLALAFAVAMPETRLPDVPLLFVDVNAFAIGEPGARSLNVSSPWQFPSALQGVAGWALGVFCFCAWCAALLPRRWHGRHGWRRAMQLLVARVARERVSRWLLALAAVGSVAITVVWLLGGLRWESLAGALLGLAFGGALVWSIRIVGSGALGEEAMGFGDVTLMAMIGAFLGWQPTLMSFVIGVFSAVFVALGQKLFRGERVIPFGPFLCLGALITMLAWRGLWLRFHELFAIGWIIPVMLVVCLGALGMSLVMIRMVRDRLARP